MKRVPALPRRVIIADVLLTHARTNLGSSDTELMAFAVIPWACAGSPVVSTVTPVANVPITSRNSRTGVDAGSVGAAVRELTVVMPSPAAGPARPWSAADGVVGGSPRARAWRP